ncbi:MAG: acetate--CoA ligase family protein [Deltaproteobacteria bacterium]|nr:acetate--CoA ligase family protein [Deltaproteobacteria bacterium]
MRNFFDPESVVMIGAPRKTGMGAYNGVEMMLRYGYKGRLYPVNPKADQICGLKAYPSVAEVPEKADLAIISVGRDHVIEELKACMRSGIRRVIVVSQGFSDADQHGRELQREISRLTRESGMRVLGPNTLGIVNNFRNFSTAFVDLPKPEKVPPVSLVAQTGVIQVATEGFAYHTWGKALDIGNAVDVDFVDALEYFGADPETRVIVLHMEGVFRGRDFLEKASQIKNSTELKDAIRGLVRFDNMAGPRLGVLTPTGAGGIMATDACEDFGLTIGEPPEGLADKLKKGIPDWIHIGNPLDIWPVGMIGGGIAPAYRLALTELLKSPKIDGIVAVAFDPGSPIHKDIDVVDAVRAALQETGSRKPISMWVYGSGMSAAVDRFESIDSVACFDSIEQAVQGLSFCYRYRQIKEREISSQRAFAYERNTADGLLRKGRERKVLMGEDALALLAAFGIPVIRGKVARSWKEIKEAAETLAYPLVLKLSGEAFLHKSEWGGVATGLRNKKELRDAYQKMKDHVFRRDPKVKIGFQIQEHASGKELLMGLKRDPQFGHILACGMGGIYTEVFKDISRELVPIGRREAEKMLLSLKMHSLLKGVRGEAGVDREGVLETLERLSFLATEVPDISELDINPLMADVTGCRAVDARILW